MQCQNVTKIVSVFQVETTKKVCEGLTSINFKKRTKSRQEKKDICFKPSFI